MTKAELKELIRLHPNGVLRLILKNGDVVDIEHPELTLVSDLTVSIGLKDPTTTRRIARDSILVGTSYIDRVEVLPALQTKS